MNNFSELKELIDEFKIIYDDNISYEILNDSLNLNYCKLFNNTYKSKEELCN